jgi:hypothetical protein
MRLGFSLLALLAVTALATCASALAAPRDARASAMRVWRPSVTAPAQFDLSLAEVRFGAAAHVAHSGAAPAIRLSVRGATGLDYVAGAVTRFAVRGRPRALVLVLNRRPRGSLAPDLARIGLTVTSERRLGAPVLAQIANPFTRPATGVMPALCDLPIRGASLRGIDLRGVLVRGVGLEGFDGLAAIAQAYDAVCRRAYDPAFRRAVTQGLVPTCEPAGTTVVSCCPPNAMCAPPCGTCPCGPGLCPVALARGRVAVVVCPLAPPPIACPL